ncbi:unnamed protein product [Danaus chrysippus]|uniref:(African queen) hypothetical protein n=1 Tax=Danaus chrysippus TaxID=151541 RepID=A0A8J2QSU0_9NEOP|nr:unnamed protein product [Danaus chrysippus]
MLLFFKRGREEGNRGEWRGGERSEEFDYSLISTCCILTALGEARRLFTWSAYRNGQRETEIRRERDGERGGGILWTSRYLYTSTS